MILYKIILTVIIFNYTSKDVVVVAEIMQPNFEVSRIEKCSPDKGPMRLHFVNVTNKNGKQYASFDGETSIPWDDNVGVHCKIEYAANGKLFVPLLSVQDKNTCKAANQYLNDFWHDIQRAANMQVGVCPLAPGRYRAQNVLLDFKKIAVHQTVPFGTIKLTINLVDNKNPSNKYFCILVEVQNRN